MDATVIYLGAASEPQITPTNTVAVLRVSSELRERIREAAIAAADQWNEQTGNTLLGGSNTIEHYRLVVDFAVRQPEHPVEFV